MLRFLCELFQFPIVVPTSVGIALKRNNERGIALKRNNERGIALKRNNEPG
ncbi:MAG: hypothetical protein U7127_24515 [Phormidium sp.]